MAPWCFVYSVKAKPSKDSYNMKPFDQLNFQLLSLSIKEKSQEQTWSRLGVQLEVAVLLAMRQHNQNAMFLPTHWLKEWIRING